MDDNITYNDMKHYIDWIRRYNKEKFMKTGIQPVVYSHTYGCQQNVSDGEKINGMLSEMGYILCASPDEADLVLFNTCAVRENAEDRIFGNVGALKRAKRRNPGMIVALCGCMMQQDHIVQRIKKSFPYVDLVFGTHALPRFPELLYQKLANQGRIFETEAMDGEIVEGLPVRRDGTVKAWLPIMYGCDNFCTYCVVPLVRGRERSREPENILREARQLIGEGYKEITLLGQNVNSYGKGLAVPITFAELLRQLCAIPGEFRLRFMTSHPKDCTRELIDTIAANSKLCSHIHLPVQSGSDRILTAMNRKYTREEYLSLIRYARETIPGVSFTSDIIVGFPGETQEDFEETLSLVREVGYHSLFTFLYSPRRGTKAAEMDDPIETEQKMRWFQQLLDTQHELGAKQYGALVGKNVRVLCEGPGGSGEGYLTGRTETGVIVEFIGESIKIGQFVDIKVTKAKNWAVLGEIIE